MDYELGIIEGFYGKPYSENIRDYLIERAGKIFGYHYYVYAPKNDVSLRRQWKSPFSKKEEKSLLHINDSCVQSGIEFSLGLSPLNISNEGALGLKALKEKLNNILDLIKPSFFCLLFDDIIADCMDLGKRQNEVIHTTLNLLPAGTKLVICPSFYTFDPILEKIFGKKPENYFVELGRGLENNSDVSFFWTGNKVLSTSSLSCEDMQKAEEVTRLRLSIWDNYPVNDGKNLCKKIFVSPFMGRVSLSKYAKEYKAKQGNAFLHFVNPMCEGALSTLALSSLPLIYKNGTAEKIKTDFDKELELLFEDQASIIQPYLYELEAKGLDDMPATKKEELLSLLEKTHGQGAIDLKNYLLGNYVFDPACLTS